MHLRIFVGFFLLLFQNTLFSQCPQGDYLIKNQNDIDTFLSLYPNCTSLKGDLIIEPEADSLSFDLSTISYLKIIEGSVFVRTNYTSISVSNPLELNLIGGNIEWSGNGNQAFVKSTQAIGRDLIYENSNNEEVTDLEVFIDHSNLSSIQGSITLRDCSGIRRLTFLNKIDFIRRSLILENLESLDSLNGLQNISEIGSSLLIRNTNITSCTGLENLRTVGWNLLVEDNPNLNSLKGLDKLESVGRTFELTNLPILNLEGLGSLKEVAYAFSLGNLTELKSFNGLNSLKSLARLGMGNIAVDNFAGLEHLDSIQLLGISALPFLVNLEGFDSLNYLGRLLINDCLELSNIGNFGNDKLSIENISIYFNPKLTEIFSSPVAIRNQGSLQIYGNPALKTINTISLPDTLQLLSLIANESLEELHYEGKLKYISDNLELIQLFDIKGLDFLSHLVTVENDVILENFNSFAGLKNLRYCGFLNINDNDALLNLDDFYYLKEVNSLRIWGNDNLENIEGICDLHIQEKLDIIRNPKLENCICESLCSVIEEEGTQVMIRNNGQACSSVEDFGPNCIETGINIQVYHDIDKDNILDSEESILNMGEIIVNDSISFFPTRYGQLYIPLEEYTSYQITYQVPKNWKTSNDISEFIIESTTGLDSLLIGVYPEENSTLVSATISADPLICKEEANFLIEVHNYGSTTYEEDLIFTYEGINENFQDVLNDSSVLIEVSSLLPGESFTYPIAILPPSGQEGEVLDFRLRQYDNNTLLYHHQDKLTCIPNSQEKLGIPFGVGMENKILPNKELRYTIRFQNDRACPARHIIIEDSLDNEVFDLNSIRNFTASHPLASVERKGNVLKFVLENICLPDSTHQRSERSAFVAFSLMQVKDLPDGTKINNEAKISIDAMDTIFTNTDSKLIDGQLILNAKDFYKDQNIFIYPNPATNSIKISNVKTTLHNFEILDILGNIVSKGPIVDQEISFSLPNGIYIVNIYGNHLKLAKKLMITH
jgi:hypothetical protein